jgi:hypothetical protein
MNEREKTFLIGLEKLTRQTGITIAGCGCCGSPFLNDLQEFESEESAGYGIGYAGEVTWISPSDEYSWKNYNKSIVKSTTPP